MQPNRAFKHIAEFVALVGDVLLKYGVRLERYAYRLHFVFLRVWHKPFDFVSVGKLLYKIGVCENDFLVLFVAEKLGGSSAERVEYVLERCNGRGGKLVFKLRYVSLCKLASVRKLLLRQIVAQSESFNFDTELHIHHKHVLGFFFNFLSLFKNII